MEVWSWCLMPNHVHIIAVPRDGDGLGRAFRHVHRHDTFYVNARLRVTGHLWQGRFSSVAMDEQHLHAAFRYVVLNPVRARLVEQPQDWRWSSVRAHFAARDDELVEVAPALERYGDFAAFLGETTDDACAWRALRQSETSGRPIGSAAWLTSIEKRTGRVLVAQKRGPKPKAQIWCIYATGTAIP